MSGAYFPHKVTYYPSCHSLRLLHVGDRPIRLLRGVEGLEYTPMEGAYPCCGFGGTFAMKNTEVSSAMLDVSFEMGFSNAQASNRLTSRGPAA